MILLSKNFPHPSFDLEQKTWKILRPMIEPRAFASTAVLNEYICIVGGQNIYSYSRKIRFIQPVELYDPKLDEWTEMTPLDISGRTHVITEWKGSLYAMGGFTGENSVMKKFDSLKNKWTTVCEFSSELEI